MRLLEIKEAGEFFRVKYYTTWETKWSGVIDLLQVFLNDLSSIEYIGFANKPGETFNSVKKMTDGLLYTAEELQEEKAGLMIKGKSKVFNESISIIGYTNSRNVDLLVWKSEDGLSAKLKEIPQTLDTYVDSLEINAHAREAKRLGLNLFKQYLSLDDKNEKDKLLNFFKNRCRELNIKIDD